MPVYLSMSIALCFKQNFMVHKVHSFELALYDLLIAEKIHQAPGIVALRLYKVYKFHYQLLFVFFYYICAGFTHSFISP